ncbi:cbb3-type cytochrome c oxidase N-terminal domain-containing protein [Roseivirga sp.]|uniref:cbb3-type cytochrome c oxidase N-terminal domain-containing protein n=1 Tax=Roseivirga sp. TaxID=1964215 RepID=UPI003B8B107B
MDNSSLFSQEVLLYITFGLVLIVALLVLVVAFYVLQVMKTLLEKNRTEAQQLAEQAQPSWFAQQWMKWNALKPLADEETILLDHDFDGIQELDNHLPPWWKGLFYLTIVYAVVYILVFHVFESSPLQEEEYAIEMAEAAAEKAKRVEDVVYDFDETTVTVTTEPEAIASGMEFFNGNCAICHKADGGGLAGPNLTDEYWRNGGGMKNIYKVIKNGVQGTAMIPWESRLNPDQMRGLASYVLTLQGTNPPGALPPDGELYKEEEEQ